MSVEDILIGELRPVGKPLIEVFIGTLVDIGVEEKPTSSGGVWQRVTLRWEDLDIIQAHVPLADDEYEFSLPYFSNEDSQWGVFDISLRECGLAKGMSLKQIEGMRMKVQFVEAGEWTTNEGTVRKQYAPQVSELYGVDAVESDEDLSVYAQELMVGKTPPEFVKAAMADARIQADATLTEDIMTQVFQGAVGLELVEGVYQVA